MRHFFGLALASALAFSVLSPVARAADSNAYLAFHAFLRGNPNAKAPEVCAELRRNIRHAQDLFRTAPVDEPPRGDTYGCVIGLETLPTFLSEAVGRTLNHFWTGKKFNDEGTALVNKVPILSPIGLGETATASVYLTRSVLDNGPIYVLDYKNSEKNIPIESLLIRSIRDEIREIAPGIFLGPVFIDIGVTIPTTLYFAVFTSKSGRL